MKTIICDICFAVGADNYNYARGYYKYDSDRKISDYEVDLCMPCVVKLYKILLSQLQVNDELSGFSHLQRHINSIKAVVKCPATDVSTSPPPMK